MQINNTFTVKNDTFIVTQIDDESEFKAVASALVSNGKDPVWYHAAKLKKDGKSGRQGGIFLRFTATGNMVKML